MELSIEKQENYLPNENLAFEITKRLAFPRLIGSDGEKKAIFIVKDEFRKIGLEPITKFLKNRFDFIIIDTPPSLGILTLNGLVAADTVFHNICTCYSDRFTRSMVSGSKRSYSYASYGLTLQYSF